MYYEDKHIKIYNKDCRQMAELPDNAVQCVITSPPYWGLRKYSGEQELIWGDKDCEHNWNIEKISTETWNRDGHVDFGDKNPQRSERPNRWQTVTHERGFCSLCGAWKGSYGLEPTPEMYVQHTIEILREIRRVLRKDGVVFWNIGDSYSGSGKGIGSDHGKAVFTDADIPAKSKRLPRGSGRWGGGNNYAPNLKPKDLCLIPFRIALAAQADGWWVRSDIIWSKPNPMPESVTDRPTNSHEYILMLTKSAKYYWDADAVREQQTGNAHSRGTENGNQAYQEARDSYKDFKSPIVELPAGRNLRSVWEFPTQPYPEAHFAVFPEKLPETCIKAATPEVGCCGKCGKPWVREIEKTGHINTREPSHVPNNTPTKSDSTGWAPVAMGTNSWQPACKCDADKVPSVVLDPFAGAGTTLWVAKKLNRQAIGFEISEEYCGLAVDRNRQQVLT